MLKWLSQGRGGAFASYSCVCLNFFQLSYMYTGPHLLHSSQFQQQIGRKAKDQLTSVREKEVTAEHLLQILAKSGQDQDESLKWRLPNRNRKIRGWKFWGKRLICTFILWIFRRFKSVTEMFYNITLPTGKSYRWEMSVLQEKPKM